MHRRSASISNWPLLWVLACLIKPWPAPNSNASGLAAASPAAPPVAAPGKWPQPGTRDPPPHGEHHLSRERAEERGRHLTLVARRVTGAVTRRDEGKAGAPGADPPCRGVPCRGRARKIQAETKGKPLPFTPPTPTPPAPVRP